MNSPTKEGTCTEEEDISLLVRPIKPARQPSKAYIGLSVLMHRPVTCVTARFTRLSDKISWCNLWLPGLFFIFPCQFVHWLQAFFWQIGFCCLDFCVLFIPVL